MGRGSGDGPPQKFVSDQYFCELCIFLLMGFCLSISIISASMDDGGSFAYPYFIHGFFLAPVLLVNLISRWRVVKVVQKKGLTRNHIIETLTETNWGKYAWPVSCKVGIVLCIPGTILTGLGGVNCGIDNKNETSNDTSSMEIRNTCYYDVSGDNADMYKGLAIGLIVIHVASFVYLLLSNCPQNTVLDQIKEDPRKNTVTPTTNNPPVVASTSNNTQAAQASGSTTSSTNNANEMRTKMQKLETRLNELETRERYLGTIDVMPPPPSYSELLSSSNGNHGANPV